MPSLQNSSFPASFDRKTIFPPFLQIFSYFPEIHDRLMTIVISPLRKNLPQIIHTGACVVPKSPLTVLINENFIRQVNFPTLDILPLRPPRVSSGNSRNNSVWPAIFVPSMSNSFPGTRKGDTAQKNVVQNVEKFLFKCLLNLWRVISPWFIITCYNSCAITVLCEWLLFLCTPQFNICARKSYSVWNFSLWNIRKGS